MQKLGWVICLIAMTSCGGEGLPGPSKNNTPVRGNCGAEGADCKKDGDCCGYCQTHNAYVKSWMTCAAPLADGSYCLGDRECQSGHCINYACGNPVSCMDAGKSCQVDADCCAGTYCQNDTYMPIRCQPLVANGVYCSTDSHCQSGHCTNYQCTN